MSTDRRTPDCSHVSGLLQPYVDGELADPDRETVLGHLDGCSTCRAAIVTQQRVRAALRGLEPEAATLALRNRILAELDRIDAEQAAHRPSWLASALGRMGAFMRGGMLLAPATAAAVGLFFVVRANIDSDGLATRSTALVEPASPATPPSRDEPVPLAAVDGAFPTQFASEATLPPGVQLVSAGNAEPRSARVQLRQGGAGFSDLQRRASDTRPEGEEQVFRGRHYYLRRDLQGRPVVQFETAGVLHELTWDGPGSGEAMDGSAHLDHADVRRLVDLAHTLQSGPSH
jgi:anti-sigma factor RsiW